MRRVLVPLAVAVLAFTGLVSPVAHAAEPRTTAAACPGKAGSDPWFWDLSTGTAFAGQIGCLRYWQVTAGQADGSYRPGERVTRGEMATFVARAVRRSGGHLPKATQDHFRDDQTSPHQSSINALAQAGIMRGGGQRSVKPYQGITRIEMAALLVRAHDYRAVQAGARALKPGSDAFKDDNGYALSGDVDKAAAVGIIAGTGTRTFSPSQPVRRDHMAAFLTRLLDVHVSTRVARVPAPPPAAPRPVRPAPVAPKVASSTLSAVEQAVLNEINAYRRAKGLRQLSVDTCLTKAARAWSAKLARDGRLSHGSPVCSSGAWAENVAYHYEPGKLFELWRDSPGHNANLLRRGATKMGIGIVAVPDRYGTRYYATTQSN